MKLVRTHPPCPFSDPAARRDTRALLWVDGLVLTAAAVLAVALHFVMDYEGQEHSWATGFYWTPAVMTTLGFGDITFTSDLGRLFSIVVLVSGVLLVLPFAFTRYSYAPWFGAGGGPVTLGDSDQRHRFAVAFE